MSNTIYSINKGINMPLEFRGLKAQYIGYLAGGLISVLVLFSVMYISGLNAYLSVVIGFALGAFWFFYIYQMNNRYGQFGWMQKRAKKKIPKSLVGQSRKFLIQQ